MYYTIEYKGGFTMNNTDIIKAMETPEGKARMVKWIEKYLTKEKAEQDIDGFSNDDWLYSPEKLSEADRENVEELSLFYEGVANYSKQNHIYPVSFDYGNFYLVKLNDFGFEIGIYVGQGISYFFNKAQLEDDKEFLDFNDIINGKKQDNVDQINATLDSLSSMVVTAYESGVPIEAITNTLSNTINEITSKKDGKKLVRK